MEVYKVEKALTPEDVRRINESKPVIVEIPNTNNFYNGLLREIDEENMVRVAGIGGVIEQSDVLYSPRRLADIIDVFQDIEKGINPEWSDLEKATYYYAHLILRLQYSRAEKNDEYNIQSLEGLLAGKADSFGLATIYKVGMDRLGIPCRQLANSRNSWNEIMIDQTYYPLDLGADSLYFHEQSHGENIGLCNFLTDKEFYFRPDHSTSMLSSEELKTIRALDPKVIENAFLNISGINALLEVEEKPEISLKSKELKGLVKGDVLTGETQNEVKAIEIEVTDSDFGALKDDLKQLGKFYPELLEKVELKNTTSKHIDMQEVVDEIYDVRKGYENSPKRSKPLDITISSSNAEDFDLDFSHAPTIQNPEQVTETNGARQTITLNNTSGTPIKLPNFNGRMSSNIDGLVLEGFDISDVDFSKFDGVKEIKVKAKDTVGLASLATVTDPISLSIEGISDAEFDNFIRNVLPRCRNLFRISITNQSLRDVPILELISRNPSVVDITINNSHLNNLTGLELFNNSGPDRLDRLASLSLWGCELSKDDFIRLMEFYNRHPLLDHYGTGFNISSLPINPHLSRESADFINSWLYEAYGNTVTNDANLVETLTRYSNSLPYYITDAQLIRGELHNKLNPMMLTDDSQIDTYNFNDPLVSDGTLLLTMPQIQRLIASGKSIPQKVRIKIADVTELTGDELVELHDKLKAQGVNLEGIQMFDRNKDNWSSCIAPITVSEYKYVRDTLDMIVSGIDPSEPDIDRFMTVYTRICDSIVYDDEALGKNSRDEAIYAARVTDSSRNLVNGLMYGKCVCSGYADILRNALALVNINCRGNCGKTRSGEDGGGHAWNQVELDDGTGTKRWYYADPTWDRTKGRPGVKGITYALRGSSFRTDGHEIIYTENIPTCENDDYDRTKVAAAYLRAKARTFDFVTADRTPIVIPPNPDIPIQMDEDYLRREYDIRIKDMYAKYYGNVDYEAEYLIRSERFKSHEIETDDGQITYRTIEDYPEYYEDAKFLILEGYRDAIERMTRYEAGDTTVYNGTPEQVAQMLENDREYVRTRNHTYDQFSRTYNDLATLGKYGERLPYIPHQTNLAQNVLRVPANIGIYFKNLLAPVYRGIGRYIAQPIQRAITRGEDSTPYRNNPFHRMIARREYFLDEANRRDQEMTELRRFWSIDPNMPAIRHPARNRFMARINALFRGRKGNEAVLRAGAQDIRENLRRQTEETTIINTLEARISALDQQISDLQNQLRARPYVKNAKEVQKAIADKIAERDKHQASLDSYINNGIEASIQTDPISDRQHSIASKEAVTLGTTVIKGYAKGAAVCLVGPNIHTWIGRRLGRGILYGDTAIDVAENLRNTATDTTGNKTKPRNYKYDDVDLGEIPTSRRSYRNRNDEPEI